MNERLRLIYPDGKQAAYRYNEKGQLAELATAKGTISYAYDEMGHLKEKTFPGGTTTSYSFNAAGRLARMRHEGEGFKEEYSYQYDLAGNKIQAHKLHQGMDEDNGSFDYGYDALNRLTEVARDGKLLRKYTYDAFGNRILKEDYSSGEQVQTRYQYNANNQMTAQISGDEELTYAYDRRGNLTAVSRGEELLNMFSFDAANRMSSAIEIKDGMENRVQYSYNAFGNRTGQDIYSRKVESAIPKTAVQEPQDPQQRIRYTLDLTRQYHNLLVSEEEWEQKEQLFYWDGNVAAMEETGKNSYYLQDDLGSPMQLVDEGGEIRESYGFDEFGLPIDGCALNPKEGLTCQKNGLQSWLQPFGYTGYQQEAAGGLYYAQARRYDAGAGRFISKDRIAGFAEAPYTLNRYNYCWNSPMNYVDLNGKMPMWVAAIVTPIVSVSVGSVIAIVSVGAVHSYSEKDKHYNRNKNQEEYFSQYTERELIRMAQQGEDGWKPADDKQNIYHRFTNGEQGEDALYNVKYLRELPDGTSYEMIICELEGDNNDYIVKDPKNMGTYNYTNPNFWGILGHGWYDVVPYMFLSNTPDGGLTVGERFQGRDGEKEGTPDFAPSKECPNE